MLILRVRGNSGNRILLKFTCFAIVGDVQWEARLAAIFSPVDMVKSP
jgi:hypothetical protein